MALSANVKLPIRGGSQFGYSAAPGVHIYAGALLMFTAAGTVQPLGLSGGVAFAGVSDRELDNTGVATASPNFVIAQRGIVCKMAVPAVTYANMGAAVYATDDTTLTLSSNSGANPQVGTVAGFEGGSWIKVVS